VGVGRADVVVEGSLVTVSEGVRDVDSAPLDVMDGASRDCSPVRMEAASKGIGLVNVVAELGATGRSLVLIEAASDGRVLVEVVVGSLGVELFPSDRF
jgi:hypothetical protein